MTHPLFDRLDAALRDLIPPEPARVDGAWAHASRRTYNTAAQLGSGTGPFRDVIDLRWRGTISSTGPIGGMAFLSTAEELYWIKAPELSPELPLEVSLHAYAEHLDGRATFAARVAGASLPGVPVPVDSDLREACSVEAHVVMTGRVSRLARAGPVGLFVLLFPRQLLTVGRKRLWRVRHEVASALDPDIGALLTEGRTGTAEPQR